MLIHNSRHMLKIKVDNGQVLIPLDHDMFWLSRVLRICESLEKHSGVTFKSGTECADQGASLSRLAARSTLFTPCRDGFHLPRSFASEDHPLDQDKDHAHHHDVQMPHHHDWHHEGHKGCNYTFTSLGGLWDCKMSHWPRNSDNHKPLCRLNSE